MVISFNGPFFDKEDGLLLQNGAIRKAIPPQVEPGLLADVLEVAGDFLQISSFGLLAGNAILNMILKGSLQHVWSLINTLQVIIFAPLINIQFPGNAFMFFEKMFQVAIFEVLPSKQLLSDILPDLDHEVPFSVKFDRLGFKSQYLIMNMGTMFFVFCLNLALITLYLPCKMLAGRYMFPRVLAYKLSSIIFFQAMIIFTQEAYLDLLLSLIVNYYSF